MSDIDESDFRRLRSRVEALEGKADPGGCAEFMLGLALSSLALWWLFGSLSSDIDYWRKLPERVDRIERQLEVNKK
jgi:hypothetical protein